jgi:hypothetical protein
METSETGADEYCWNLRPVTPGSEAIAKHPVKLLLNTRGEISDV